MVAFDDFAIARHYFKRSHGALEAALGAMNEQAVRLSPQGIPGRGLRYGPVGIYKYHYPAAGDRNRHVRFGLCFDPTDENDEVLYDYQRYEAGALRDPRPVRDGFYAFVEVGGPSRECQQVPGFSENRWYELDEDENLAPATDPLPINSTGWYCYQDDQYGLYARICPVHELLDDENQVGNGLRTWAHAALQQALQLWRALFGDEQ